MRVPTVSPAVYRRITMITLASLVFIMVTGAAVRLTGSGLGCSDWPTCEESSLVPRAASGSEGWVEFGNRLVTGLVMVFTLAAVLGARWRSPRRDDLFRWSLGLPVWVMGNAIVGAMVVWLELAPVSVIGHFLLSLGAVWNAVVLHHKASEDVEAGESHRAVAVPAVRRLCDALLAAGAVALVTGTIVTGSGPHAGDEEAERLGFEVADVARIHGIAVIVFGLLTLLALWRVRRGDATPVVERRLQQLLGILFVQGAIGYTQYFSGVPAWLVALHVLGAALVWIALVRVRVALNEPVAAPSTTASPAPLRVETAAWRPEVLIAQPARENGPVASIAPRASTAPVEISPVEVDQPVGDTTVDADRPWVVIVWNDPINLMSYVTYVLQKLFGYQREVAEKLMLQVHYEGRAVVSSGTREKAELDVFRLHEHQLWATLQQD